MIYATQFSLVYSNRRLPTEAELVSAQGPNSGVCGGIMSGDLLVRRPGGVYGGGNGADLIFRRSSHR